jgi:DNA polymerase-3 subunit gamma/tau
VKERLHPSGSKLTVKIEKSKNKVSDKGIISIKDMMKPKEDAVPIDYSNLPKEKFTEEHMRELWTKYAYSIRNKDIEFFGTLTHSPPILKKNVIIQIAVFNSTQKNDINTHRQDLLHYLRSNLKNHEIDIEVVINEVERLDIAFTPQQKLKKLIEKNPKLGLLKDKLNLEL